MLDNSEKFTSKFSHRPMKDLSAFLMTFNGPDSQAFAVDANANDVQTTGTKPCVIAGVPINSLTADAALDISADKQLTEWASGESYTAVDMRYVEDDNGRKQWYKCIASHTSSSANKPGDNATGDAWLDYWTKSSQTAEQASGDVVASGNSMYYLALVNSAGTLTLVKASDDDTADADIELKIPNYEPEVFCAIGLLLIDSAGFTLGTTSTAGVSTFTQLYGPVFPHPDNMDTN